MIGLEGPPACHKVKVGVVACRMPLGAARDRELDVPSVVVVVAAVVVVVVVVVAVVAESGDLASGDGARAPPSSSMSTGALWSSSTIPRLSLHGLQTSGVS